MPYGSDTPFGRKMLERERLQAEAEAAQANSCITPANVARDARHTAEMVASLSSGKALLFSPSRLPTTDTHDARRYAPRLVASSPVWLVNPRIAWLCEPERSTALGVAALCERRIPLQIEHAGQATLLASLLETEFRVGVYPPAFSGFAAKVLAFVTEEKARSEGRGNPLALKFAEDEVMAAYAGTLAQARSFFEDQEPETSALHASSSRAPPSPPEATKTQHDNQDIERILLAHIRIDPERRRLADTAHVAALAQSIAECGLLMPIVVDVSGELVAGLHRVLATEGLGDKSILGRRIDLSGEKKRLACIDENLIRRHLPVLEQAELTQERQQIYEHLHPEAKQYSAGGHAKGARAATELNAVAKSFAADTAAKTNMSVRTVQQYAQIANLSPTVKNLIRQTPTAERMSELVALARLPEPERLEVAQILKDGQATRVSQARGVLQKMKPASYTPS
jgi:ParB family chromosome partitioning protein